MQLVERGEDVFGVHDQRQAGSDDGAPRRGTESTDAIAARTGDRVVLIWDRPQDARLDIADELGRMPDSTIADGAVAGPYFRAHDETAAAVT